MSVIWDKLDECKDKIIKTFDYHAEEIEEPGLAAFNQPDNGWINRVWSNEFIRRAHIDVVAARETKGLWMMHVCIFPQLHNDSPIYGFDVIAGKNKMTGAFHDFSRSSNPNHPMIQGYFESVEHFVPEKQRELPEWATNIFTGKMLAAGNVKSEEEATEIIRIATDNLDSYMWEIKDFNNNANEADVAQAQDYYCHNQQQNPHTANVMKSLGLAEDDVEVFCRDMLFPKLA